MSQNQTIQIGQRETTLIGKLRLRLARRTEGRAVVLLAVVLIVVSFTEPLVFTAYQVSLGRIALIGLVALGLTAVILMGELDLSVASTLAVSGVVMALIPDVRLGVVVALGVGLLIGFINGFFVAVVGINSFIATLGMLFALRGLAFILSDEAPVRIADTDAGIAFGLAIIGPLTPRVLIFILAFILLQIFVSRVKAGREFFAVGGNRQAAYDAGIPVKRRIFTGFMISGLLRRSLVRSTRWSAQLPTPGLASPCCWPVSRQQSSAGTTSRVVAGRLWERLSEQRRWECCRSRLPSPAFKFRSKRFSSVLFCFWPSQQIPPAFEPSWGALDRFSRVA